MRLLGGFASPRRRWQESPREPREQLESARRRPSAQYAPLHEVQEPGSPGDDERDERRYSARLGAARMVTFMKLGGKGSCQVQKNSVYGAAIAIPQLARSSKWSRSLLVLTCRSYIFLLMNYVLQGGLLYFIAKEELIWDLFAGQMYLCDFGAKMDQCPGGPNCVGPSGTEFSAARLYSWSQFSTRSFVRDSLKAIFPHRAAEIHDRIDPGEYGVESYWCRWLCCFLYFLSVMNELNSCVDLARLFVFLPSEAQSWIDYEVPTWAEKEAAKAVHDWSEFDLVKLRIMGMSRCWKFINILVVFLPKVLLWKITCEAGATLLMETSGIEDVIINSVALAFVLNIDEMMCEELMSQEARMLLSKLEPYERNSCDEEVEHMSDDEVLQTYESSEFHRVYIAEVLELIPVKLVGVVVLTVFFVFGYYKRHCVYNERGGWVSKPMHLPLSTELSVWDAFFPNLFHVEAEEEPFWEYKPPQGDA